MIQVEGHKNLFRDENSNAIVNTDRAAYNDYINSRRINSDNDRVAAPASEEITLVAFCCPTLTLISAI